jgi:hypothetical protein
MPDQHSAATEHELISTVTEPLGQLPQDPLASVPVDFPIALRGYDRIAVDAYVERTTQLIAELQSTRSPQAAVRRALERVGEEISGILQRAHDTADEITARSRAEAEERLETARREAVELTAEAERRVAELDAETDRIWAERHSIVTDVRDLASRLTGLAEEALDRFPPASPVAVPPAPAPAHPFDGAVEVADLEEPVDDGVEAPDVEESPADGAVAPELHDPLLDDEPEARRLHDPLLDDEPEARHLDDPLLDGEPEARRLHDPLLDDEPEARRLHDPLLEDEPEARRLHDPLLEDEPAAVGDHLTAEEPPAEEPVLDALLALAPDPDPTEPTIAINPASVDHVPSADDAVVDRSPAEHAGVDHAAATDHGGVDQPTAEMPPVEPWEGEEPGPFDPARP